MNILIGVVDREFNVVIRFVCKRLKAFYILPNHPYKNFYAFILKLYSK